MENELNQPAETHQNTFGACDNLVCAVHVKTSGPTPYIHDIIEFNILPIDSEYNRSKVFQPFHLKMWPKRPENSWYKYERTFDRVDYSTGYSVFESWYDSLQLRRFARIIPLVFNWPDIKPFLNDFFGFDENNSLFVDSYFKLGVYKDIKAVILYLRDIAFFSGCNDDRFVRALYTNFTLRNVMHILGVPPFPNTNNYHICMDLMNTYKRLASLTIPSGIIFSK